MDVRAGVGIMLLKDNKVLFGKRNSDPEKASSELHGENTWTMPGGKIHFGEKIAEGPPDEIASNEKVIEAYLGSGWKGKAHA